MRPPRQFVEQTENWGEERQSVSREKLISCSAGSARSTGCGGTGRVRSIWSALGCWTGHQINAASCFISRFSNINHDSFVFVQCSAGEICSGSSGLCWRGGPSVSMRRGMRSAVTRPAATATRRFDSHSRGRIMRGLSSCGGRVNKYCITTRRDTCRDCVPVHSGGPGGAKSLSGHNKHMSVQELRSTFEYPKTFKITQTFV